MKFGPEQMAVLERVLREFGGGDEGDADQPLNAEGFVAAHGARIAAMFAEDSRIEAAEAGLELAKAELARVDLAEAEAKRLLVNARRDSLRASYAVEAAARELREVRGG